MSDIIYTVDERTKLRELIEFFSTYPFTLGDLEAYGLVDEDVDIRLTSHGIFFELFRYEVSYEEALSFLLTDYTPPEEPVSPVQEGTGSFVRDMANILVMACKRREPRLSEDSHKKHLLKTLAQLWQIEISFPKEKKAKK